MIARHDGKLTIAADDVAVAALGSELKHGVRRRMSSVMPSASSKSNAGDPPHGRPLGDRDLAGDEQLTRCGLEGVDVLYRRHHPMVDRYCLVVLRVPESAADAAQSTWMHVSAALCKPDAIVANFRPWLRTIARNECFDLLRAREATQTLDISTLELAGEMSTEDRYESREQLACLLTDLQSLSQRQRSAIVLREFCGIASPELADMFETTPKRASGLVADARRTLMQRQLGRSLPCERVRDELERRPHSAGLRAHLEICPSCHSVDRGA